MAYTQSEIDQVRQAILDLTNGQRATMVVKDGRTIQYQRASLPELRAQLRMMIAATSDAQKSRTRYVVTNKGL